MDRYADRLDADDYLTEEPAGVGLASESADDWSYVPASVFRRLLAVGSAYDLHVLGSIVEPGTVTRLNPLQCEALLDEIAFVGHLVNDPLLARHLPAVTAKAAACARSRSEREALVLDLEP